MSEMFPPSVTARAKGQDESASGKGHDDKSASRWLRNEGKIADRTSPTSFLIPPVSINRIVQYAHNRSNRRRDLCWAGAIALVMLGASFYFWYQNRLDLEMTHSSWPAHTRRVMFHPEIE